MRRMFAATAAWLAVWPVAVLGAGRVGEIIRPGEQGLRVTETRLTTSSINEYDPAGSGFNVVYTQLDANNDVYRLVINGEPGPLVQGPGNQYAPDIDGYNVVYVEDISGTQDIWHYDLLLGTQTRITWSHMPDTEPAISGDYVVYQSTQAFNMDVFCQDLIGGTQIPIANSSNYEAFPSIDGDLVAWMAIENNNYNIKAKVIFGAEFSVATTAAREEAPSVSGNYIGYTIDGDVAVFDYATGQTIRVTEDSYTQGVVKVSGNFVYFHDNRNGNLDIFVYDLLADATYQLTSHESQQQLSDADGNRAFFYDSRFGSNDIFMVEWGLNQRPVASAGPDQSVFTEQAVGLDGLASFDPEGDPIVEYLWAFESMPAGSTATIVNPHLVQTSFIPDLEGDYVLSLVVFDGELWSLPDLVIVSAASNNLPPLAEAGADQDVFTGQVATLDGSASWDLDGDPITGWSWTIIYQPPGSTAVLVDPDTVDPAITPDLEGNYVIELIVFDGEDWSEPDWVTLHATIPNTPPEAYAGDDQQVDVGETVYLSGSGWDPDEDPIVGWFWKMLDLPGSSMAVLSDPTSRTPTFVADVRGVYLLSLRAFDGEDWGEPDTMQVIAVADPDLDNDGDVDGDDVDEFEACASGPGIVQTDAICCNADFDGDDDVDQADFAVLQAAMSIEEPPGLE